MLSSRVKLPYIFCRRFRRINHLYSSKWVESRYLAVLTWHHFGLDAAVSLFATIVEVVPCLYLRLVEGVVDIRALAYLFNKHMC